MTKLLGFVLLLLVTTSCRAVEETVNNVKFRCGKKQMFECAMTFSFENDCSEVTKVIPSCNPKKKKCTKPVSFVTESGCKVSGTFRSTGQKQTFTLINVSPPPLRETVNISQVKCGKVTYQHCKMEVTYKDDCSSVSKIVPNCSPKRSKCTKGVSISFATQNGCTVTGMYKNTGKKQSMSKLAIGTTTHIMPMGGTWSEWGEWSECRKKIRHRHCNASSVAACEGSSTETASCSSTNTSSEVPSCPSGLSNSTSLSVLFFDFVFTNANQTSTVPCCLLALSSPFDPVTAPRSPTHLWQHSRVAVAAILRGSAHAG